MKKIPLTKGQVAIVDLADYDRLVGYKWRARWDSHTQSYYAVAWDMRDAKGIRRSMAMHREVVGATTGQIVDHRNHNSLDNRRANLRICTPAQNASNARKSRRNTSGFKGVCWHAPSNQWQVRIGIAGKQKWVGYYRTIVEAARAYDRAAKSAYGEFSATNSELGIR